MTRISERMNIRDMVEAVKDANPIEEVVQDYIALKRSGGDSLFGLCPFHNEKTPSFHVRPSTGRCSCYGCNENGDVIDFVMKIENIDFIEAMKMLADRANIKLETSNVDKFANENFTLARRVLNNTSVLFNRVIKSPNYPDGMAYLEERNISEEMVDRFRIGFNPMPTGQKHYLVNFQGVTEEASRMLEKLDIIKERTYGEGSTVSRQDQFKGRVTLPVRDLQGRVLGFTARKLDHLLYSEAPKYVNSTASFIFDKSKILYGLYESLGGENWDPKQQRGQQLDRLLSVEGGLDVVKCVQHGFPACAPLGTQLHQTQAKMMWRFTAHAMLVTDNDAAGLKATLNSIKVLASTKQKSDRLSVVRLEGGKDPDEVLDRYGPAVFEQELDRAQDAVDFLVQYFTQGVDPTSKHDINQRCEEAAEYLSDINNEVFCNSAKHYIVQQLGIDPAMIPVKNRFDPAMVRPRRSSRQGDAEPVNTGLISPLVKNILTVLHARPGVVNYMEHVDTISRLSEPGIGYLRDTISNYQQTSGTCSPQLMANIYLHDQAYPEYMHCISQANRYKTVSDEDIVSLLNESLNALYSKATAEHDEDRVKEIRARWSQGENISQEEHEIMLANMNGAGKKIEFIVVGKPVEVVEERTDGPDNRGVTFAQENEATRL